MPTVCDRWSKGVLQCKNNLYFIRIIEQMVNFQFRIGSNKRVTQAMNWRINQWSLTDGGYEFLDMF